MSPCGNKQAGLSQKLESLEYSPLAWFYVGQSKTDSKSNTYPKKHRCAYKNMGGTAKWMQILAIIGQDYALESGGSPFSILNCLMHFRILGNSYLQSQAMAHNPLVILGVTHDVARSLILCNKSTTLNATGRLS
ncbi:hypothetical protein PoB_007116900 [Plakobranchus ocellatus]|uniref:Uncharacterized protein n=1 Tax=Plakobranchus ocellatus TaxID=259542 RepID=A0AAV4DKF0_9GAST|nr:hypothetical protein PoB_007116900 [Plakobranchus ocellatus]